jgi:hypothetical protein
MVSQAQHNGLSPEQFDLLLKKQIVKEGIFIQIYGDEFDYRILKINDDKTFIIKNIDTKEEKVITYNDIRIIEDMSVDRIMEAYLVDEELNTLDIIKKTDVCKNVIGKKNCSIDGNELEDGMKIILHKDVSEKFNNKVLTVSGVGNSIKLSAPRGRPRKNT